jgi:hypothetical protein
VIYDYEKVTEVRLDRDAKRLELIVNGKRVAVEGVEGLFLKSIPFIDEQVIAHLNKGRVSIGTDGIAVAGD